MKSNEGRLICSGDPDSRSAEDDERILQDRGLLWADLGHNGGLDKHNVSIHCKTFLPTKKHVNNTRRENCMDDQCMTYHL